MCLTSPATVIRVAERGGICVVTVLTPDEGERDCLTYVEGLEPGERVLIAGGAIVERFEEERAEDCSLASLLIEAFDATHQPGGTQP
jgi:hydrogenase maturation factor